MKNVNKVFLLGNVSREPEIKQTASGKKVAVFGIATNRDWTLQESHEKQSLTEFHNCVAWGKLADLCEMYLSKGKLVYAEGYLKTRSWDDEYGRKQFRTEIVLMEVIILEKFSKKDVDDNHEGHLPAEIDDFLHEDVAPSVLPGNADATPAINSSSPSLSEPLFNEEDK